MLVGNAGLGKSVLVGNKLSELSEDYAVSNVPFNYYTTSEMLQGELNRGFTYSLIYHSLIQIIIKTKTKTFASPAALALGLGMVVIKV